MHEALSKPLDRYSRTIAAASRRAWRALVPVSDPVIVCRDDMLCECRKHSQPHLWLDRPRTKARYNRRTAKRTTP